MTALFLSETDVDQLIDMNESIEIVERSLMALHQKTAVNVPRARVGMPGILLHTMSASAEYLGVVGWKAYTSTKAGVRFHVALYDGESGELQCLLEANRLGQLRTGAATGVAVRHLSPPEAASVGMIGSGFQARTQLEAICAVRPVVRAHVFSRSEEHRNSFATEMSARLGIEVQAVESVDQAVSEADIVVCATNSPTPVLDGSKLKDGALVAAIGGNQSSRTELDGATLERAVSIVVDDVEQCQIEAGELIGGVKAGLCRWEDLLTLGSIINGDAECLPPETGVTLFKSVGLAVQDVAMAQALLAQARSESVGTNLPF